MNGTGRFDILIVGGGASGTLLAVQLLQRAGASLRIAWVDPAGIFGRGLAYGAAEPFHLLNVPAGKMSAFPDRPDGFLAFCSAGGEPVAATDFVPRLRFGDYLEATLEGARRAAPPGVSLARLQGEVVRLRPGKGSWEARLGDGGLLRARDVVLACGNAPPAPPACLLGAPLLSPWDAAALDELPRDAELLLLGTGLTMADVVLSLLARGHRGRLVALSRHGLLPLPHDPGGGPPLQLLPPAAATCRELLRWMRAVVEAQGGANWRQVVDGLRPHTARLWQALPADERRRFLRHLRTFWDVHRHRLPPAAAAVLRDEQRSGQLRVEAGRVVGWAGGPGALAIRWRPRGTGESRLFRPAAVINCTGPATGVRHVPLLRQLVEDGLALPDPLGLGLATAGGRVVGGRQGGGRLLALGPLRRGELYETTAVPEIRAQAAELAQTLLATDAAGAAARLC